MQRLSWHSMQWHRLSQMLENNRLPHAFLLTGPNGVGKLNFVQQLSRSLLCESINTLDKPCKQCPSCQLLLNDSHPDHLLLTPEEGKKLISVDSIRAMIQRLAQTRHRSKFRTLIIHPADAMTTEAANSLLKTLEEPPAGTLLFLITDKPNRLLPTIRSRMTRLNFTLPDALDAIHWFTELGLSVNESERLLALSLGSPLKFGDDIKELKHLLEQTDAWWESWLALIDHSMTPLEAAKQFKAVNPEELLIWLDLLISAHVHLNNSTELHPAMLGLFPTLDNYKNKFATPILFQIRDRVLDLLQRLQSSMNWELQLESLLLECSQLNS